MSDLLQLVVSEGASDLHIRVGTPPTIRVHGILHRVEGPLLTPEDTEELMRSITSEDHIQHVRERGGADFGFAFGEMARFRVSVFKEKGNYGLVLRKIPSKLLTMEQIGIPPSAKELLYKPRGLVLVTGPTGSGKTTTLASMINIINEERDEAHIITIEDPIEYYHKHKKALVTQREIGVDVPNFAEALRRALRLDPDVVLVGEMRDLETIDAAITAAETGHLVFGTLHTTGAAKTIDRVVNAFPTNQQVIIADGTYPGNDNVITMYQTNPTVDFNMPPNGTAGAYTIIRAQNEGAVWFDGEHTICMFGLEDHAQTPGQVVEFAYVEFRGINWIDPKYSDNLGLVASVGIQKCHAHHIKFFRCGGGMDGWASDDIECSPANVARAYGTNEWAIECGHHMLFEECYAWGVGRYGFKIQDIMTNNPEWNDKYVGASQIVLRRCVVRLDRAFGSANPIAGYISYCAEKVEWQNCIVLDADPSYFNADEGVGGFVQRFHDAGMGYCRDNQYRGCISYNLLASSDITYKDERHQRLPDGTYWSHNPAWAPRTSASKPGFPGFGVWQDDPSETLLNSLRHCVSWDCGIGK